MGDLKAKIPNTIKKGSGVHTETAGALSVLFVELL
jgi:hypothetical protein